MTTIYTIGHSTRSTEDFISLLNESKIRMVVDVRSVPYSRRYPQHNTDALAEALASQRIDYEHLPALGGHRKGQNVPSHINMFWTHRSFHNYADYAMSEEFKTGLDSLLEIGRSKSTAYMCAEAVWWKCHRRIITDYVIASGFSVKHILGAGQVREASLTKGAECCNKTVRYHCEQIGMDLDL